MRARFASRIRLLAAAIAWLGLAPALAERSDPPPEGPGSSAGEQILSPEGETALPDAPALAAPSASAAERSRSEIERAWHAPASSLEQRVVRTRRAALAFGAWNLDPAARAIVLAGAEGDPLERAQAAVTLAPDLPVARMHLARAQWLHGGAPMSAIRNVIGALRAATRHLEASLWFAGSGLYVLAVALVAGGLLLLAVSGLAAARHAAHDLGHLLSPSTPAFAGCALLASLALLPLALGEGPLGVALVALAVALVFGRRSQRNALVLAAAAILAGAYPVAQGAGALLEAFPADPVGRAAFTVAHGFASPVEVARLEAAAERDALAARALAVHARRVGNLGRADALYQGLLADHPTDLMLMNNAANVRLELGHMESALDLYRRAIELEESAVVLFNLSQAYGRAFQVDDLNRALAHAQSVDAELVGTFTALQGGESQGFVVDLPLPNALMWERVLAARRGGGIAAELREPIAPGRLGQGAGALAGAAGLVALASLLARARFRPSRRCERCGGLMCPRCRRGAAGTELCQSCTNLFFHPEKTDRALRVERVNALREREERMNRLAAAVSMIVPGAAGLLAGRPLASLFGALCFALAISALVWRGGVVPDPLVAGSAAPFAFLGVVALSLLAYVTLAATSLASRRSR